MSDFAYSLAHGLKLGGRDAIDWEAGMMVADVPPAPVRIIEITDAIRAEDAAKQAAREQPVHAWSIKSELSVENLRRKAPIRKPVIKKQTKARKPCPSSYSVPPAATECAAPVPVPDAIATASTPTLLTSTIPKRTFEEVLNAHFGAVEEPAFAEPEIVQQAAAEVQPIAAEVDQVAHAPAQVVQSPAAPEPKYCLAGCGRAVRRSNTTGFCFLCNNIAARAAQIAPRPKCKHEVCTRLLRNGSKQRTDGLCGYHGDLADKAASGGQYARKLENLGRKCTGCEKLIGPTSKSGKCQDCARTKFRTVLLGTSREEFELNELWAALSVDDRWAVLQDAVG